MIALAAIWAAAAMSASARWQGTVALDTLAVVKSLDTLRIEGPCRIEARTPKAGLQVYGTLLVSGDEAGRVVWNGGRGIEVASGANAYFTGFELAGAADGLLVGGGRATLWESRLTAQPGKSAATLNAGELVVTASRIEGRSPALLGRKGVLELDDVELVSDTLWNLDPQVVVRFQDVTLAGRVRIGQNPSEQGSHAAAARVWPKLRWAVGTSVGTRVGNQNDRREVVTVPVRVAMDLGSRVTASVLSGWRSGWLDRNWVFNERDQTLLRLQARALPLLDLAVEAGYGGAPITWDRAKADLAVSLLDRSMDLEEPFAAPGPLAGGRALLHGRPVGSLEAAWGLGYQWRGSSGTTDLGDVLATWTQLALPWGRSRTEIGGNGVWCLPDRIRGHRQALRWQWSAVADHRQDLGSREWGLDLSAEGFDKGIFGQRLVADLLWGKPSLRYGPVFSVLLTQTDAGWGTASGPGVRWRYQPTSRLRIDLGGLLRVHRDVARETWLGGDLLARVSGGF